MQKQKNSITAKTGIAVLSIFLVALLSGCWITRNWKDYLPITSIGLDTNVKNYTGFFIPRTTGRHVLALRIKKTQREGTVPINLHMFGMIKLCHGNGAKVIEFDRKFSSVTLPPTTFNLHIAEFTAEAAIDSQNDYGCFTLTVEGDLEDFIMREPFSQLAICFADAE